MLADPKWRERVIFDLGGHWALRDWQARQRLCQQRQNQNTEIYQRPKPPRPIQPAPQPANINTANNKRGQFRLPPLTRRHIGTRQCFGRAEPSPIMRSSMNTPIIVTPYELTSAPARQGHIPSLILTPPLPSRTRRRMNNTRTISRPSRFADLINQTPCCRHAAGNQSRMPKSQNHGASFPIPLQHVGGVIPNCK